MMEDLDWICVTGWQGPKVVYCKHGSEVLGSMQLGKNFD
jgi:hypothetical protein